MPVEMSGSLPSNSLLTVPRSPLTEPILWTISPNCSTVSRRSSACSRQIWLRRDVLISFRICTHSFAKTVAVCVSRASKAFVHLSRRVWSRDSIWVMLRSNFVVWVRSLWVANWIRCFIGVGLMASRILSVSEGLSRNMISLLSSYFPA